MDATEELISRMGHNHAREAAENHLRALRMSTQSQEQSPLVRLCIMMEVYDLWRLVTRISYFELYEKRLLPVDVTICKYIVLGSSVRSRRAEAVILTGPATAMVSLSACRQPNCTDT